jgi:DNA-directed RNA polymerase specialized sigma24 family protein
MTGAELERLAREQRARLLCVARRRARTREDAEDAVQEALTIAYAVRERIRPETALGYISVTARHEALRLRRHARQTASLDEPTAGWAGRHETLADPRRTDHDAVLDALDGLQGLTRDQARALMARALGWRYEEIAAAFGWTYTKTNRSLAEGRAAMRDGLRTADHEAEQPAGAARPPDRSAP